jgi:CYTH domain-containing protein
VLKSKCNAFKDFLITPYRGIVINKYINSEQHSAQTVEIKNFTNNNKDILILDFDITNFYNKININDTIFKEVGKDSVFILNKKGAQAFILDFGCNN